MGLVVNVMSDGRRSVCWGFHCSPLVVKKNKHCTVDFYYEIRDRQAEKNAVTGGKPEEEE